MSSLIAVASGISSLMKEIQGSTSGPSGGALTPGAAFPEQVNGRKVRQCSRFAIPLALHQITLEHEAMTI